MQEKKIDNLIINKVENQETYEKMKTKGLINNDELYLVGGGTEVTSVNGQTGDVTLTADDVGALPANDSSIHTHSNKSVLDGITSTKTSHWDTAYTHSQSAHAPSDAEKNVITSIQKNGTAITPANRVVNITVPTKTSDLTNDSDLATNASVDTKLEDKVDKVSGKGLSTNDYTTAEKTKLAGIAEGANNYSHPTYTAKTSGLYKITVNNLGHVSAATAVSKADITGLGIPAQDTVYTLPVATSSTIGGVKSGGDFTVDSTTGAVTITHQSLANYAKSADVTTALSGKANSSHTHTIANVTNLQSTLDAKVPTSRTVNGKALSANITLTASDVGALSSDTIDSLATKTYVDNKTAGLTGAMHFQGAKDEYPPSGTYTSGDVILYGKKEYVYDGKTWHELGDEGSHVLNTQTINGKALSGNITLNASDISGTVRYDTASQGLTSTQKANARTNIGAGTSSFSGSYNDLTNKPTIPSAVTESTVSGWGFTKNSDTLGKNIVGTTSTSTSNGAVSGNGVYLNHIEGTSTVKSTHKITGAGATKVTSDANGNITITSTDNDTVYTHPTYTRTNNTSKASPAHGETFTAIDSITTNNLGHVTAVNTKTVTLPADSNTHYSSKTIVAGSAIQTANAQASNGFVYLNHVENGTVQSAHLIQGTGATTVTSNASGTIIINSPTVTIPETLPNPKAFGLQLNSGEIHSYDGTQGITINLTPGAIGAAASSHSHTITDITNLQTTLDGKSNTGHTHNYLPLSGGTLTGNLTGKYITGTWLQTTAATDKAGKFATIDDSGWIYYRTASEVAADIGAVTADTFIAYTDAEIQEMWDNISS